MKDLKDKAIEYAYKNRDLIPEMAIRAYIAGATEAMRWISVKDELPPLNKYVIVAEYELETPSLGMAYYDGDIWHSLDGSYTLPTFWLPIPELPKPTDK